MADTDKFRIKPFDDKGDYRLWRIRIEAACDAKEYRDVLDNNESDSTADDVVKEKFAADQKKASNLIIHSLADKPLRVVRSEIGNPFNMMKKLDERYDSKSTATRISKMTELVSLRYSSMKMDIGTHIDQMAGILEQLDSMNTPISSELCIALLIASISVPELAPVTAAVKTLADDVATWDTVTARLIEEHQSIKMKNTKTERAAPVLKKCEICDKPNHTTAKCFFNPKNPNNRLKLPKPVHVGTETSATKEVNKERAAADDGKKKIKKTRTAVARAMMSKSPSRNMLMLDSGTTSHMTPYAEHLEDTKTCAIPIALGDDSTVTATSKGTLCVEWCSSDGQTEVKLSETLASEDLAMSLLSIPALTEKGLGVLFMPTQALIIDLYDKMRVVGSAPKQADGLYYIGSKEKVITAPFNTETSINRAMMAIIQDQMGSSENNDNSSLDTDEDTSSTDEYDSDVPDLVSEEEDEYDSDSDASFGSDSDKSDCDGNVFDYDDLPPDETEPRNSQKTRDNYVKTWHSRLGHMGRDTDILKMTKMGILPVALPKNSGCDPCSKGKFRRFFRGSLTKASTPGWIHVDVVGRVKPSREGYLYFMTSVDEKSRYVWTTPLQRKGDASKELIRFMNMFERQTGEKIKGLHTDGGSEFFKAKKEFEDAGVIVTTSTPYTAASNGLVERSQGVLLSLLRTCMEQAKLPIHYWQDGLQHVTQAKNIMIHGVTKKSPYVDLFKTAPPYAKHMRPFGCRVLVQPIDKKLPKFSSRLIEGVNLGHVGGGLYRVLTENGVITSKHVKMIENQFPGSSLLNKASGTDSLVTENETLECETDSDDDFYVSPETEEPLAVDLDMLTHIPFESSKHGEEQGDVGPVDEDEIQPELPSAPNHGYSLRSRSNVALPTAVSTSDDPSISEAMSSPESKYWQGALKEEFRTLKQANTWKSDPIAKGRVLPSGVILKLKRDEKGLPARFKARLVARGNLQDVGQSSYTNRYAPVACFDLVRILLALSAGFKWARCHVDVKGAFLYAQLPEKHDIWMRLPKIDGISEADGSVVKLIKSIYGLREAPKLWYKTLASCLSSLGFKRLTSSECVFILRKRNKRVLLLAYVDDLGMFGDQGLIEWVKVELQKRFKITDLGKSDLFLGVTIQEDNESILLTQKPLIQRIIESANLVTAKPTRTPLPLSHPLYAARRTLNGDDFKAMESVPFREILGSLLFLSTRTRPDISTAVSMLGKFASAPAPEHWKAMKQVIRYLQGTSDFGIHLWKGKGIEVEAWSDADWARDLDKRRSRSGVVITVGGSPVLWKSKLQPSTSLSTTEAEFYALSECVRDIVWVRQLFAEIGLAVQYPTNVYQDNLGTISWTTEVQGLRKVKHVGIRYSYVREAVDNQLVNVLYTPSIKNKADSLTKALVGPTYEEHRTMLSVAPASSRRGVLEM